ncbi:transglycosylase domain-containing protein [Sphaerisporangium sp. B11E5]|uniref:transglycosylase domain-containing protein n=1 Tax=Sphaerisporangium sp. B11E5 TaxID=3153563 RepID=UPI00325DFB24
MPRSRGQKIARLVAAGAAAGVLAAGLALPAVGGAGAMIAGAADDLKPMELAEPPLAEKTTVVDAGGRPIAQFWDTYREVVPLSQVAEVMRTAIVAIEDYRFYEHGAIDLEGTVRALARNLQAGGVSQGGSGLTQQYVKQVLLNTAVTEEEKAKALESSYTRKITELRYAMGVERKYTKNQILEKYLNIAYFGAGANGIEAAAKRFFGVHASRLTLAQAATLAGAVQLPTATDPEGGAANRRRLLARRDVVLDRMVQLGKITAEQAAEAKATKLGYKGTPLPGGCTASPYPYFCVYVREEFLRDRAFGATQRDRALLLSRGGLTIHTTLDRRAQAAADRAIRAHVAPSDDAVAAEALVQPGTGMIKAMAASRRYGTSARKHEVSYNIVADEAHGGIGGFQAGSTFKTFTLITALKQGMKVDDGFTVGNGFRASGYADFVDCAGGKVGDPTHTVTNDEGSPGFKSLSTGTWQSVNTFFMELERRVGLCDTVQTARSLGIKRADGRALRQYETFTLGINEMDPVTVATAYAAIAARGRYCAPMAVTRVVDRDGKATDLRPRCREALDPEVADATAHILSGVFTKGTMRSVGGIGRDAAGKTGTNDDQSSAWFAGFTPDLAGAVSIGDPRGAIAHKLNGVTIGGRYYGAVFGATIPGPIWRDTMLAALKGVPATPFTAMNTVRFGGCGGSCRPAPPPPDDEERPVGDDDATEDDPVADDEPGDSAGR